MVSLFTQVPWSRGQDYPPGDMTPGAVQMTNSRALQGQDNGMEGSVVPEVQALLGGTTELRAWPASLLLSPHELLSLRRQTPREPSTPGTC